MAVICDFLFTFKLFKKAQKSVNSISHTIFEFHKFLAVLHRYIFLVVFN